MPPEELNPLFRFRPIPGPGPDPASLLQFFVDHEQPAARKQAFGAFLQLSLETFQAQVKFVKSLQEVKF